MAGSQRNERCDGQSIWHVALTDRPPNDDIGESDCHRSFGALFLLQFALISCCDVAYFAHVLVCSCAHVLMCSFARVLVRQQQLSESMRAGDVNLTIDFKLFSFLAPFLRLQHS